jgi:integrase
MSLKTMRARARAPGGSSPSAYRAASWTTACQIITPEEFDLALSHLTDPMARLLVRTATDSGLRWGELTELRTTDLDTEHGTLTVSRSVVELRGLSRGA